jgi:hypothetical protein
MARIDDYKNARQLSIAELDGQSIEEILLRSGFEKLDQTAFCVPFLDRKYRVTVPGFIFSDIKDADKEVPIQEQVLILHYLEARGPSKPTGSWVSYREIPGAGFYFSAFVKRAIDPMKKVFGQNADALMTVAAKLGAKPIEPGDAAFEILVLPRVPLQYILWEGDEEFAAEANILFDETAGDLLSPEDLAWLAGMVVYRMMALNRL